MVTDEQIQKHIEENCRYKDGQPLMDEQAFYEGAKWMREKVSQMQLPVKPANGGKIFLLYKRIIGHSGQTPELIEVFVDEDKALDRKYELQKYEHAYSYFIEDSRLSV